MATTAKLSNFVACYDSAVHRYYLLCTICKKVQRDLGDHLRRTCMKDAAKEHIKEAVHMAKADVQELLKSGRFFSYDLIQDMCESVNPVSRYVAVPCPPFSPSHD